MAGWMITAFGNETWTRWYVSLFITLLMLLGTGVYACFEPEGPRAGPMLMLMVFLVAFCGMLVLTSVDIGLFARRAYRGFLTTALFVVMTWIAVGVSCTFLFWATDPNYPHMLLPGGVLFIMHSLLLYGANLWLLWQIRWREPDIELIESFPAVECHPGYGR